jgi:hypothetical protein
MVVMMPVAGMLNDMVETRTIECGKRSARSFARVEHGR